MVNLLRLMGENPHTPPTTAVRKGFMTEREIIERATEYFRKWHEDLQSPDSAVKRKARSQYMNRARVAMHLGMSAYKLTGLSKTMKEAYEVIMTELENAVFTMLGNGMVDRTVGSKMLGALHGYKDEEQKDTNITIKMDGMPGRAPTVEVEDGNAVDGTRH
jgi:hypothetical protein